MLLLIISMLSVATHTEIESLHIIRERWTVSNSWAYYGRWRFCPILVALILELSSVQINDFIQIKNSII